MCCRTRCGPLNRQRATLHSPVMNEDQNVEVSELRAEIEHLLADALRVAADTRVEADRVALAHHAELAHMQTTHNGEMTDLRHKRDDDVGNMHLALGSRDVIGQAKGIIMATMHCTADEAFGLLRLQSQAENRKLVAVAAEMALGAARDTA